MDCWQISISCLDMAARISTIIETIWTRLIHWSELVSSQSIKILFVEDEPGNAQWIRSLLAGSDFVLNSINTAGNLKQYLDQHPIDLILLDLSQQARTENNLFENIQALAKPIPIIVITANGDTETGIGVLQAGAQDYLIKDEITSRSLIRTLQYVNARQQENEHQRQLLACEQEARQQAEAAQQRLAFLTQASALLGSSLDYHTTLSTLTQLLVPALADYCMIDILEGDQIKRIAVAHANPAKEPVLHEIQRRYTPSWGGPQGVVRVMRTGEIIFVPDAPPDAIERNSVDEDHYALLKQLGARSFLLLPLIARDTIIGAASLVYAESERHHTEEDISLAQEVARYAAQAVDNARLYRQSQEAMRALNDQKNLFETILTQAADAVAVCDQQRKIVFANTALKRLTRTDHLESATALDNIWGVRFDPEGNPIPPDQWPISLALRGQTSVAREVHVVRQDGSFYDALVSAAPLLNDNQDIIGAVAVSHDITERRRAEKIMAQALAEADQEQRRLQAVMDALPVGVLIANAQGGHVQANEQYYRIWGGSAPVPTSIADYKQYIAWWSESGELVQPEEWGISRALLEGKTTIGDIIDIQRFDGTRGTILNSGAPIRDAEGNVTGGVAALMDITELRATQEQVRLMARFPQDNPSPVLRITAEGRISYSNKAGDLLFDVWGCQVGDFLPDHWRKFAIDVLKTGLRDSSEIQCYDRIFSLQFAPVIETNSINIYAFDITERKWAEEALRVSEERLRFALIAAQMTAWDWEIPYNGSTHTTKILDGITAAALKTAPPGYTTTHPQDEMHHRAALEEAIRRCDGYTAQFRLIRPASEEEIWFEDRGHVTCDSEGRVIQIGGVVMNVTDRKRAEAEIQKLNTELEQRVAERTSQLVTINKELEAFSYSVSHDLRAPLRAIDGFSLALLEDETDRISDEGKYYLQRVRAASQHMGHLIDDLLKLSRLTRTEIQRETIDLSTMVREIADERSKEDPGRAVEWIIEPGVIANGDPRLIRVVLENLINNAWKFTSKRDNARIEFGCSSYNDQKTYFVRDNGAGFDMAYVDKLFGAFQRLHTITEFEGTGIGLATAQRIIHRHGGRIWAESIVNQGAAFYFTLQIQNEE